ncbi:MAG: YifB family Mg chelatase-like AAA ATPase [Pseudomonadales bacterium]|nr:YifB family Mg chelatase-like AAA ATPase [Pseudomonadales bacterium]
MSLAVVTSRALLGIDAVEVTVETHLSNGLPGFAIVGMPETAVRESKERVRSAILNSGLEFPERRITVNLAPADLPKTGGQYDLAIAASILAASDQIPTDTLQHTELMGELALNGEVRAVRGVVAAIVAAKTAGKSVVLPAANSQETNLVAYDSVESVSSLLSFVALSRTGCSTDESACGWVTEVVETEESSFLNIRGQTLAKRAIQIAAAGRHDVLLVGPPGCGKTMLAQNLTALLPALSETEAMEVAAIRSVTGLPVNHNNLKHRPIRSPHHSATHVALVGGGAKANPGEVTLAHRGVLFLDEFSEFKPGALDALREPMEVGEITLSRANYRIRYPADFQLVAAMNPCPCGYASDRRRECRCPPERVSRYLGKLSGPLLDRMDLSIELPGLTQAELLQQDTISEEENTQWWLDAKQRVQECQQRQLERACKLNNALTSNELEVHCRLNQSLRKLLANTMEQLGLSARSVHRIIKVARTIADLAGKDEIEREDLLEAIALRRSDCLQRIAKY